jgi:ABC-type multidrug transport system, ATPase component
MSDVLKVQGIEKNFGSLKAINNISFSLEKGDVYGFLGPNGSGKTTTIRIILGLLRSDKGEVFIDNINIKEKFYAAISRVGALVEGPAFYEYLTAEENLGVFAAYSGDVNKKLISELLDLVGLSQRAKEKVEKYSYGMKQRLGIAQALLNRPKLLILDEPINGLDPQGIKEIRNIIIDLSKNGTTVFLSSHILSEVEQTCNKVMIINKGKHVTSGYTRDLINTSNTYDIVATDQNCLLGYLHNIEGLTAIPIDDTVRIKFNNNHQPEDLLADMIRNDLRIKTYCPAKLSLEDYFFDVMGESNNNG